MLLAQTNRNENWHKLRHKAQNDNVCWWFFSYSLTYKIFSKADMWGAHHFKMLGFVPHDMQKIWSLILLESEI